MAGHTMSTPSPVYNKMKNLSINLDLRSIMPEDLIYQSPSPDYTSASGTPTSVDPTNRDIPAVYSTMPHSNYSLSCESPISPHHSVVSSPMAQVGPFPKMLHTFPSGSGSGGLQQPTPPGSARTHSAEWLPSHGPGLMMTSDQSSSPEVIHSPVDNRLVMPSLESTGTHVQGAQRIATSASEHPSWTPLGVQGTDPQDVFMNVHAFVPPFMPQHMAATSTLSAGHMFHDMSNAMPSTNHAFTSSGESPPNDFSVGLGSVEIASRRGRNTRKKPGPRRTPKRKNSGPVSPTPPEDNFPPIETLRFNDDAPPDAVFLLDLYRQKQHRRGIDMWYQIDCLFSERYPRNETEKKESLQMKLNRAIDAWAVWPKYEDGALMEAAREIDSERMVAIRTRMKQKGGLRTCKWTENMLANRLIALGYGELAGLSAQEKPKQRRKNPGPRPTKRYKASRATKSASPYGGDELNQSMPDHAWPNYLESGSEGPEHVQLMPSLSERRNTHVDFVNPLNEVVTGRTAETFGSQPPPPQFHQLHFSPNHVHSI